MGPVCDTVTWVGGAGGAVWEDEVIELEVGVWKDEVMEVEVGVGRMRSWS